MKSGVRIVKHGRDENPPCLPLVQDEKTEQQREREIVSTIKGWINEWKEGRRGDYTVALARIK